MFVWVHVDETWFYLMKGEKKVHLQLDGEVPKPSNEWFILKMMFLAAVARPRKLSNGGWFDRKIGIWPTVDVVTAQLTRTSCARGDPVLRPVMVDGERHRKIMMRRTSPPSRCRCLGCQATLSLCSRTVPSCT
ncbi:unnamed protein product [Discosporangium mesarthrocarpum]